MASTVPSNKQQQSRINRVSPETTVVVASLPTAQYCS